MSIPPGDDPFELFGQWYADARKNGTLDEPTAMTLATASPDGQPHARVILLKGVSAKGFDFYTNTRSDKGRQLAENPKAALCFYWMPLGRQVRVEGSVTRVTDDEADAYFASRRRGSQIGAWASEQSAPLDSRAELLHRVRDYERKFEGANVPRPPHWHGYRLAPLRIEFWAAGEFRLHERRVYTRSSPDEAWEQALLNP